MEKVINTQRLRVLNSDAILKYPRFIPVSYMKHVDPKGRHVLGRSIGMDTYVRVFVQVKMKGSEDPIEFTLDMSYKDYNSIPEYKEAI